MRNWHHSGFSVHNEVVINENEREALGRLAQYVVHASFSAEKIRYVEKTNCVMYKSKLHRGKKRNFEVLDAIEFLHRVCLHIPEHYEALIRYYGHYANAARPACAWTPDCERSRSGRRHAQAEREKVIRILKHLEMWPIEYSKPCLVEARASPFDFKLLRKLSD